MATITDEDILAEVKARNLQEKIFTDDMIIAEVAMRSLGLQVSGLDLCQDVLVGDGHHVHIDLLVGY